jgi:hypothetical protein
MLETHQVATLQCGIAKLGNGYAITIVRATPRPAPPPVNPEDEVDPDHAIDKMIDGLGALVRSIHDSGAGETWKSDEDRAHVRAAFKLMFPGMSRHLLSAGEAFAMPPIPESLVFETKEKLIAYLTEKL